MEIAIKAAAVAFFLANASLWCIHRSKLDYWALLGANIMMASTASVVLFVVWMFS